MTGPASRSSKDSVNSCPAAAAPGKCRSHSPFQRDGAWCEPGEAEQRAHGKPCKGPAVAQRGAKH